MSDQNLGTFRSHVPEGILADNHNLEKFLGVFEGMLKIRKDELDNYVRRFYYPAVSDIRIMRRYVDEWDAEYLETSTRLCVDCLYRNYSYIYSRKGTVSGIKKLLQCLFYVDVLPEITIDSYTTGKPLILSDDRIFVDWLPNGSGRDRSDRRRRHLVSNFTGRYMVAQLHGDRNYSNGKLHANRGIY